jgi:hypothetical protein
MKMIRAYRKNNSNTLVKSHVRRGKRKPKNSGMLKGKTNATIVRGSVGTKQGGK